MNKTFDDQEKTERHDFESILKSVKSYNENYKKNV